MAKNLTLSHEDLNPGFLNKTFPSKINSKRYPFSKVNDFKILVLNIPALWQNIFANVKKYFGLFITHFSTNSSSVYQAK